jgi:hypothetical protein
MDHQLFGRILLVIELVGLLGWFGIATWYQTDASLDPEYRFNDRNILFHYASVGGVVNILRELPKSLSWLCGVPFVFALLADTDNLIYCVVNLTRVNHEAWVAYVVLTTAALCATLCSSVWFLNIKLTKN